MIKNLGADLRGKKQPKRRGAGDKWGKDRVGQPLTPLWVGEVWPSSSEKRQTKKGGETNYGELKWEKLERKSVSTGLRGSRKRGTNTNKGGKKERGEGRGGGPKKKKKTSENWSKQGNSFETAGQNTIV